MTTPEQHLGHHIGPMHTDHTAVTIHEDAALSSVLTRLSDTWTYTLKVYPIEAE